MVDRYAKHATEHLAHAASRIERVRLEVNVVQFPAIYQLQKSPGT